MLNNRPVRYLIRFFILLILFVIPLGGVRQWRPEWLAQWPWLTVVYGVVALFAAALLGYIWYNRQEYAFLSRSRDIQRAFTHLVSLAEVPPMRKTDQSLPLVSAHDPSEATEAFQTLYASVRLAFTFSNQQYLLVTSANRGEGKTVVAANLAQACARAGKRVLLVEGHWDAPKIHDYFALPRRGNLGSLLNRLAENLQGYADARSWARLGELRPQISDWLERSLQPTAQANLFILTNGTEPIPQPLRQPILFRGIMDAALGQFDMIICDGPPMLTKDSAWQSLAVLGEVLLVAAAYHTRRAELYATLETLRRHPISPIGAVLNHRHPNATFPKPVELSVTPFVSTRPTPPTPAAKPTPPTNPTPAPSGEETTPPLVPAVHTNGKHKSPLTAPVMAYPVNGNGAVNGKEHAAAVITEPLALSDNKAHHLLALEQLLAEKTAQLAQKEAELEQIFRAQALQNDLFAQLRQQLATQQEENGRLQETLRQQNEEMFMLERAARTRIQALEQKLATLQSRFQQTSLSLYRRWQTRDGVSPGNQP